MEKSETIEIEAVRFTIDVGEYTAPEDLEWVPDAAAFVLQVRDGDGGETEQRYGYTCLEHAFLLLNRLETRESGRVLWGTGLTEIRFNGDEVSLFGNPEIVGTVGDLRSATEDLVEQIFEHMHRHNVDTRSIATNVAEGRFGPWEIDPVEVHDRLVD
ncbi:hypothetical protein [Haloprofundus salinisoli]|uniref:hypothetical protein n=1 Tax=Haloprofundus salinisoli TaxID=2876193 RepID=UPI001CC9F89C|nr:hypothetical protein [Haloprofundus salinisoli]